jgi:hypothetical protein
VFAREPKRIAPESGIHVGLGISRGWLRIMSDRQPGVLTLAIDEAVPLAETLLSESGQKRSTDMDPETAIEQLNKSDRGRKAAHAFRQMLQNGGAGLDSDNWRALEALCRFAYTEDRGAYLLYDILPTRKGGAR